MTTPTPTALNWPAEILAQGEFYWDFSLWPRLEGLTDAEFYWEPAPGAWNVRRLPDGRHAPDSGVPEPEPPPVTTIAWRLGHIVVDVLETRINWHFGDRTLSRDTIDWPGTADEAKQRLRMAFRTWFENMHELGEEDFAAPVGGAEAAQWADMPMVVLVLHLQREIIHHGAEVALMRDLYQARG
ncbi:DinB family protein [Nocardiopsis sp. HNM0947]|uniref:DinB family protein n=1 Tax=Nocardiopsis coralli TaxID=2772213 RepID=A0ABR9P0Q0_9ACTN|nr:DinB family protein [Nocardiopsis coralli]MBE2997402.1 DinB family protein [Nocardiopsis coralli]